MSRGINKNKQTNKCKYILNVTIARLYVVYPLITRFVNFMKKEISNWRAT
jgi:hypothetical protein